MAELNDTYVVHTADDPLQYGNAGDVSGAG